MSTIRNHGWKPYLMAQNLSPEQLEALLEQVEEEHANPRNEEGRLIENGRPTIFMYDSKGMDKLDALSWAVYHKTKRKAV